MQSALGHETATEWSLLAEPLEPHIAAAGVIAGMGPRVAVVTALHHIAVAAGLFQQPTQLQGPEQHASSQGCNGHSAAAESGSSFSAAAVAAGVGLWQRWIQVRQAETKLLGSLIECYDPPCRNARLLHSVP